MTENINEYEEELEAIRKTAFEISPYKANSKNDIAFKAGIDCVLQIILELCAEEEIE